MQDTPLQWIVQVTITSHNCEHSAIICTIKMSTIFQRAFLIIPVRHTLEYSSKLKGKKKEQKLTHNNRKDGLSIYSAEISESITSKNSLPARAIAL